MSFIKKSSIALVLLLVLGAAVLVSCADNTADNGAFTDTSGVTSTNADYEVRLVDAFGDPMKIGAVAQFYAGDKQVGMQAFNAEGVAKKTLERGDYSVVLAFTSNDTKYNYDKSAATVSATDTTLDIVVTELLGEAKKIFAYPTASSAETSECDAYYVSAGGYFAQLKTGRNYFLFVPSVAGTYEFSADSDAATVGYFGSTYFVQKYNVATETEAGISLSVTAGNIGNSIDSSVIFVIGVDVESDMSCTLKIKRTGDPEHTVADEPWTVYEAKYDIKDFVLPTTATLKKFDIKESSDKYTLVYNESDKYYHLGTADGPVVLVYLGENTEYIDSIQTIVSKSNLMKYFYDENGKFLKKETYAACVLEYIECMDETSGTYPLTEDLMYILKQHGEYAGWWNTESPNFIFEDDNGVAVAGINYEIAWLSFCCYAQ